jgi:crossover junction endodeoxyribonuclease RuvC
MICFGVDPGTLSVGISVLKDNRVLYFSQLEINKKDVLNERLKLIKKGTCVIIEKSNIKKVDLISIETPFFGRSISTAIKLGTVRGLLLGCFLEKYPEAKLIDVSPSEIRSLFKLKSNAEKNDYQKQIIEKLKLPKNCPEDAIDSIGVALAGHAKFIKNYEKE